MILKIILYCQSLEVIFKKLNVFIVPFLIKITFFHLILSFNSFFFFSPFRYVIFLKIIVYCIFSQISHTIVNGALCTLCCIFIFCLFVFLQKKWLLDSLEHYSSLEQNSVTMLYNFNVAISYSRMTGKHSCRSLQCNYIKQGTPAQMFSCEFYEIFKEIFLIRHFRATVFVMLFIFK